MGVVVRWHEQEIWSPSSLVGYLFFDEILALERSIRQRSGVIPTLADTFDIDAETFDAFLRTLLGELDSTNNGPFFAMAAGCAEVVIALNYRITGKWPDVPHRLRPLGERARTVLNAIPPGTVPL